MQTTTIFESLPNEIVIKCFNYLNGLDILYSFDQLNHRFYDLIRNIPLYFNFQHISKLNFDQFCMKKLSHSDIRKQIYSLKLSNNETCGQIHLFLSEFLLNTFSHLQSLTLIGVRKKNVQQLKSISPLLSKLTCFHLINSESEANEILTVLEISQLKTLSLPILTNNLKPIDKISKITNLTLYDSSLEQLSEMFKYTPMLKYLNVYKIANYFAPIGKNINFANHQVMHLKQLFIGEFQPKFNDFEILLKQTPNLKCLTISAIYACYYTGMFNAYFWQQLITITLPYLKIFNFQFGCDYQNQDKTIVRNMFEQFQNEFWIKQHHWYNEYVFTKRSVLIYTIPYIFNTFTLELYSNQTSINNSFDNVKNLILHHDAIIEECQHYFSNIRSLSLESSSILEKSDESFILTEEKIRTLNKKVNLSHLKHLSISSKYEIETSSVLLQILKTTPQLSSITMHPNILRSSFEDSELCEYLNKMIKQLNIRQNNRSPFKNNNEIHRFCEVFSNIEQLKCDIDQYDDVLVLLKNLLHLSSIEVYMLSCGDPNKFISWSKVEVSKLDVDFQIEDVLVIDYKYGNREPRIFCIWINRIIY